MRLQIGDRIGFHTPDGVLYGIIKNIREDIDIFEIQAHGCVYWIGASSLVGVNSRADCECGASKLGHPGHSTWCKAWVAYD